MFGNNPCIGNSILMSAPDFLLMDNILNYIKQKDYKNAILQASTIKAPDWKRACVEWLQRKEERSKNV